MQSHVPTGSKLRSRGVQPPFQVCLIEPEIPPNTGSIARTCGATQSVLHLVEPLGFSLDERAVRRAGLDYWARVVPNLHVWPTWAGAFPEADAAIALVGDWIRRTTA